ncbi:formylglycine-generating enzyme family protein [Yoonia vestfoldensis]|uniref:formylglycine-generating enzyme family protein n=1 Tax=Yoonia vestfoldensis TaxID=245188 RepID=UPI000366CBAB|nr:formylglycine-generating enzyme family protein [Yoonia vestfoldensis]
MRKTQLTAMIATLGGTVALALLPLAAAAEETPTYLLTNGTTVTDFDMFKECDVCPEMIVMPQGSFMMGAIEGESRNPFDFYGQGATGRVRRPDEINIIPNEHPRHLVEIDIPFAVARNEVTVAEWDACVADGGCSHTPRHEVLVFGQGYVPLGPNHPVVNVSFLDAQEYVIWLNAKVGAVVYRLPTEAEWEYAARAGTTTRFAQGDELTTDQANFSRAATENVRRREMPDLVNRRMPVEVDTLDAANAWGVRHLSGNVDEVTLSCWSDTHLGLPTASAYFDHAQSNKPCIRVGKGGGYGTAMDGLRLASRARPTEDYRRDFYGFRILRTF